MMMDVTKYGINTGATVATLEVDGSVSCQVVPDDGMLDIDGCCNPLPHKDDKPCPDFVEQVFCGCGAGCGCGDSGGGDPAELTEEQLTQIATSEIVTSAMTSCIDENIALASNLKPEA